MSYSLVSRLPEVSLDDKAGLLFAWLLFVAVPFLLASWLFDNRHLDWVLVLPFAFLSVAATLAFCESAWPHASRSNADDRHSTQIILAGGMMWPTSHYLYIVFHSDYVSIGAWVAVALFLILPFLRIERINNEQREIHEDRETKRRIMRDAKRTECEKVGYETAERATGYSGRTTVEKSVFVSYGGPDESVVRHLVQHLRQRGVRVWFFPDDAIAGERLHRMMYEGVMNHDKILLVCSMSSLGRPGVMNELEQVLIREAGEGGSERLVPVTIDDFVFREWCPNRGDLAAQIRSRVIAKLPAVADSAALEAIIDKLLHAINR